MIAVARVQAEPQTGEDPHKNLEIMQEARAGLPQPGSYGHGSMGIALSRRRFLKISAAAGVSIAATQSLRHLVDAPVDITPPVRAKPLDAQRLPRFRGSADDYPALTRRYPWVRVGEKSQHAVQIANSYDLPNPSDGLRTGGLLGEHVIDAGGKGVVLPWAPMFDRPTKVYEADGAVKALAGASRLYIKDEGSDASLLYGNKVRKFEFLLPSLAFAGVRKVSTHGGIGSNHCAYLALAARYGAYGPSGESTVREVELMLYPQEITENVMTKLRLLVACRARMHYLDGDASVGLSILTEEIKSRNADAGTGAYVPPGGSSPLTVLGHVEAVMELAEQIEGGACPLTAPPDYLFVPLGSGATAMGLVLGCQLLGWPTKVIGTCSQDRGPLVRFVANGDMTTPFLVKNAEGLLEKALKWVDVMGLGSGDRPLASAQEMLRRGFAYDNETWQPEYGRATPEIQREAAMAAASGLVLDTTFTAKSFHTLKVYAEHGLLEGKTALFWNTYQRFPLDTLLPDDRNWVLALPEPMRERIDAYVYQITHQSIG